jgi:hypothetical protein
VVVVIRERGGNSVPAVFDSESTAGSFIRARIEYNRRVSNGNQMSRVAALAMKRGKSVDFTAVLVAAS